jgi:hypothetical protein
MTEEDEVIFLLEEPAPEVQFIKVVPSVLGKHGREEEDEEPAKSAKNDFMGVFEEEDQTLEFEVDFDFLDEVAATELVPGVLDELYGTPIEGFIDALAEPAAPAAAEPAEPAAAAAPAAAEAAAEA